MGFSIGTLSRLIEQGYGADLSKSEKVAEMVRMCEGRGVNAYYAAYFEYFNREQFYEAHDVLEQLWLPDRKGASGAFYKGLIQLAGAFVHLQKERMGPAAALLKLARANLATYGMEYLGLNLKGVSELIEDWLARVEAGSGNPLRHGTAPKLALG